MASEVGAFVLRRGGNAIDASVAAGLALGAVEPWMSGIGGGGFMTLHSASEDKVSVVEFGMKAPLDSRPEDYPLTGKATGASSFNWPQVKDDANVHGPLSIAVPGHIKGMALALEQFGTWDWKDVIEPACKLAEYGLPMNWYAGHIITSNARLLRNYEDIRQVYLADGLPPANLSPTGEMNRVQIGSLKHTYRTLQKDGPESFYLGSIAEQLVSDLNHAGSKIRHEDLAEYTAFVNEPLRWSYREHELFGPHHRSAGPTLQRTMGELESQLQPSVGGLPSANDYVAYAKTLLDAYQYRLAHLGDGKRQDISGATTHLCVVDKHGNLVSHTQTIMSTFGSQVMLPSTGIVMNNGMMWFDPVQGGPNSVAGGRRPLSNMCPIIGELSDGARFAVGACGGRTIFPAVYQIVSFLCDFGMNVEEALHQPRVDVSGTNLVSIMDSMSDEAVTLLESGFEQTRVRSNGVSPVLFGVPQLILWNPRGGSQGGCYIPSPTAAVVAA